MYNLKNYFYKTFLLVFIGIISVATTSAEDSSVSLLKQMIVIAADGDLDRTEELNALKDRVDALPKPPKGNGKKALLLFQQGAAAYEKGQFTEVVQFYVEARKADPSNVDIVANLGFAYLKTGELEKAIEPLVFALSMSPGRSARWTNIAEYYARSGKQREAIACYLIAVHFSKNQLKTIEFINNLASSNSSSEVQQAAQQVLRIQSRKTDSVAAISDAQEPIKVKNNDLTEFLKSIDPAKNQAGTTPPTVSVMSHQAQPPAESVHCRAGYKLINNNQCVALSETDGAPHGHYIGTTIYCDHGYQLNGTSCIALPPVQGPGYYIGTTIYCDHGYQLNGTSCIALPPVQGYSYPSAPQSTTTPLSANDTQPGDTPQSTPSYSSQYAPSIPVYGGRPKTVSVRSYYRKDGTYVRGHYRSSPR